jgi:hypothetical protein
LCNSSEGAVITPAWAKEQFTLQLLPEEAWQRQLDFSLCAPKIDPV